MKKSNVSYLNFAGTRFRCLCSCMSVLFKADNIIIYRCRVSLSPVFLTSIVSSFLLQIAEEEEVAGDVDNIHDDQEPPRDLQLRHEAPALELASGVQAGVVQNVGQTCLQCSPILTSMP